MIGQTHRPPLRPSDDDRRQGGAALLEMAIAVGLLAVLIFGIITFGVTLSFKQTLDQATNEAARAAAVAPPDQVQDLATAAANRAMSSYDVPCGSLELQCSFVIDDCPDTVGRRCMTVLLRYDLRNHPRVPNGPLGPVFPDWLESRAVVEVNS